jgi:putative oxidoreductase
MKVSSLQPYTLSLLRIVSAFTFSFHGAQKLLGWFGGTRVALGSLLGVAGVLELAGGVLLLVGLWSRPIAFLLSGEMAVAYFRQHAPHGLWPVVNHGELAVLYCFIFLYLSAAGPGPISLDRIVRRKS